MAGDGGGEAHQLGSPGSKGPTNGSGRPPRASRPPPPGPGRREGRAPVARRTAPRRLPRPGPGSGAAGVRSGTPPLPAAPPHPRPGRATQPSLPKTRRAGWCAAAGPACGGRRRPRLCPLRTHPLPSCLHPHGAPRSARTVGPCACAAPPPRPLLAGPRGRRSPGLPRGGVVRGGRERPWAGHARPRAPDASAAAPAEGAPVANASTSSRSWGPGEEVVRRERRRGPAPGLRVYLAARPPSLPLGPWGSGRSRGRYFKARFPPRCPLQHGERAGTALSPSGGARRTVGAHGGSGNE